MRRELETGLSGDVPIVLSQWYDTTKWILEKIDKFPKNQRFIFGTRLADRSLGILEGLVQASYSSGRAKLALLETANRDLAVLRWLVRMATDRKLLLGMGLLFLPLLSNDSLGIASRDVFLDRLEMGAEFFDIVVETG